MNNKKDDNGVVVSVFDGIANISGLVESSIDTIVEFSSGEKGLVIDFENNLSNAIIFGDYTKIKRGDLVKISGSSLEVPVGSELLGRIVDPLGKPLDGKGAIKTKKNLGIRSESKSVFLRKSITKQLITGLGLVDSQVPIGQGQRELFIGEKKIGKEDSAVSAMINQYKNNSNVQVVYVTIAAQTTFIKRAIEKLENAGASKNTIFVVAKASDPALYNYLSPISGITFAEGLAGEGKDVLVIFDNLTRHARVYRQISLLMKRAPGREAYPGDIFYLHANLLERGGNFTDKAGGGSITVIPLVEVISEDVTDYITTNLMSITDGHVLFSRALYHAGRRPAINTSFSVSRLGGKAQSKVIRELSNKLKSIIAKYSEVESLMGFGGEVQEDTKKIIEQGKRIFEFLNQDKEDNIPELELGFILHFITSDYILKWPLEVMNQIRISLFKFIKSNKVQSDLVNTLKDPKGYEAIFEGICKKYLDDPGTIRPIETNDLAKDKESMKDVLNQMEGGK